MRTLIALTALMLLLATAVWWKTKPTDEPTKLPPTTQEDPYSGVVTLGTKGKSTLAEASFPKAQEPATDGGGDHEGWDGYNNEDAVPAQPEPDSVLPPEPKPNPVVKVPTGKTYTIQSGDTLYRILVRAYGSAPEELVTAIAEANAMQDPGALQVGATLKLPIVSGFQPPQQP
ncbi:MAG: LysM domain-containing protein [Planctomycetota bacterium]|nr:LysM domain-containing protein [Planctomycetota bacterium]MDA1113807.1 LysM domain-containing protein [Planctomycetota bacterium]